MKNKYEWKDLYQLEKKVKQAKENNCIEAKEYIIDFFMPYILKNSNTYFIKNYDSEDIKHHLILSLLESINKYNFNNGFFWYAISAMRNNLNSELRKRKREEKFFNIDDFDLCSDEINIDYNLLHEEELNLLKSSLTYLNKNENDLLFQYFYLDKNLKDLSIEKNINYYTLATKKRRAINKLKNIFLNNYLGGCTNG